MGSEKVVVVIPARYGSTRLPGKPLVSLAGQPMIQRVYERAKAAEMVHEVIVATDDDRIMDAVKAFGGQARMTRPDHRTGTERVAEVAAHVEGDVFVNVQGDEPLLDPAAVDTAVEALLEDEQTAVSTVATPIKSTADIMDPNVVKVVLDFDENALYFSRAPIPWVENGTKIRVAEVEHDAVSVDVPEDVARVEKLLQEK
jgi:3-deoxy-manno-octulosonate cytidylyltransferase (CMP-KDO synthetase)